MNQEIMICGAFLENISKRKRKQLRLHHWKYQQRFPGGIDSSDPSKINHYHPLEPYNFECSQNPYPNLRNNNNLPCCSSSGAVSLAETTVETENVSCLNAAGSSVTNEEFKNEDQDIFQQTTYELKNTVLPGETNVFDKGKSFEEDVEMLLESCQTVYPQIRTSDFYKDKIESLHRNHIQVLLNEKDKLNIEIEQAQRKQNKNRNLINKRLDTIGNVLNSLKKMDNFSGLNNTFIKVQKSKIQVIRSKLNDSACRDILRSQMKKTARWELKSIATKNAEIANIHRQLQNTEKELKALKIELEDKINTIRRHSQYEQERNLEIIKLKAEVNKYKMQLAQIQDDQGTACKESNGEINNIQQSLENNGGVISHMAETERDLEAVQNDADYSRNFSKPGLSQQEGIINVNEANVFSEKVVVTQGKLQALHTENAVQETFNFQENNKTELSKLQSQLAETQQELEKVKMVVQQKVQNEQKIMEQLNKGEKTLQKRFVQTRNELKALKKDVNGEVQIAQQLHEQKEIELDKVKEVGLLQIQLEGTQQELENVKKILNSKINIIQQNVRHEKIIIEQLNKAEKEENILRNQLEQTQKELETVKKELNSDVQQVLHVQKEIELGTVKEAEFLQNQLTETQHKLEETRKDLSCKVITIQEKTQHEQKVMKELNKAEEDVKLLRSQLAATQHELETLGKELNDRVSSIQQEKIEKAMEIEFLSIRLLLIKKLGFTDQNRYRYRFENYMKEGCCRGIVSDIRRLIEDKVQSLDENIPEAVSGSNIIKVTENELHLLILIASILKVVPFSASTDFIFNFVTEVDNVISRQYVECLLRKYPTLFKEESVGAGSPNKNWRYLCLKPTITI